ncbi:MAG: hypothetical protein R3E56_05560 [Burkholderiaceae bacterium]
MLAPQPALSIDQSIVSTISFVGTILDTASIQDGFTARIHIACSSASSSHFGFSDLGVSFHRTEVSGQQCVEASSVR